MFVTLRHTEKLRNIERQIRAFNKNKKIISFFYFFLNIRTKQILFDKCLQ